MLFFPVAHPLIGMLHLPALPGSPKYAGDLDAIRRRVLDDAAALVEGGAHGAILENVGDAPFLPGRVPAITVAHMTALAACIRREFDLPLGINVLRNDGMTALAIAHAVGAQFIRVNVLCGARVTDQGIVQGIAHELLRERAALSSDIRIFADVNVKHSAPLANRPLTEEVSDLIQRGGADAIIVSGAATGAPADLEELRSVKDAAGETPVLVGSGVTAETTSQYAPYADGFIVGTSLKRDGRVENPIDVHRVRSVVRTLANARSTASN
jgi:membrane complex biogenesis BtpA family protein